MVFFVVVLAAAGFFAVGFRGVDVTGAGSAGVLTTRSVAAAARAALSANALGVFHELGQRRHAQVDAAKRLFDSSDL